MKKCFLIVCTIFFVCFSSYSIVKADASESEASVFFYGEAKSGDAVEDNPKTGDDEEWRLVLLSGISSLLILVLLIKNKEKEVVHGLDEVSSFEHNTL